jgi:hypothetical protein
LRRLQNACSSATDERLNLKYKNSLLERILLEKGELNETISLHLKGIPAYRCIEGIEVRAELDVEVPIQPKKVRKERQPSIRRSKPAVICRRHSSITSEPMDLYEICSCHPSISHNKNLSNIPSVADQSRHVTERKRSLPSNMMRWRQTHRTTHTMGSAPYDTMGAMENSVSHLGKYLPTLTHFLERILWS